MRLVNKTQAFPLIKRLWLITKRVLANQGPVILELHLADDKVTDLQRRYYHGYVLVNIANQARVHGQQFNVNTWKNHFRKKYLGTRIDTVIDPMSGITYKDEVRVSTEDLGVKKYSELIQVVTAEAATEWGVKFPYGYDDWVKDREINGGVF